MSADRLNIITERYEPSAAYDLAVAINVLTYFDRTELVLALANIQAMMRSGGWLIHNELREELEPLARASGLEPVQGRTVRLGAGLLNAFVIHKKR